MARFVGLILCVLVGGCGDDGTGGAEDAGAERDGSTADAGPMPSSVSVDTGELEGTRAGGVHEFMGIPYAAPPVGELRWAPPERAVPWEGTRDATEAGAQCPQSDPLMDGRWEGDEDCLYLNVWSPDVAPEEPQPVMVWFHGGGWFFGSGSVPIYDGAKLALAGGVVVVTINYRLGGLGFLAHPELTAEGGGTSGNYGQRDQVEALRWVSRNIEAFGGDPGNVTIFGQSAGGNSVCLHLASEDSAGLFHRAISQSGICTLPMVRLSEAEATGAEIATALGCADAADVLDCMRGKSPQEVDAAIPGSDHPGGLVYQDAFVRMRPIIDGAFIPMHPVDVLAAGDGADVPVVVGANADEGTLFHASLASTVVEDEAQYREALARRFPDDVDAIVARYPVADFDSANEAITAVTGDAFFVCPARRTARALAASGAPTRYYHFTQTPQGTILPLGAFHAAEILFVFGNRDSLLGGIGPATELHAHMQAYWTRFAANGDPNGGDAPAWPAYDATGDAHIELGTPITTGSGLKADTCDFWDGVTVQP